MEGIIVGDIVRLKKDSPLFNNYYFSKRKEKRFIIISIVCRNIIIEKEEIAKYEVSVLSIDELTKNHNVSLIQFGLPKYDLNNFYKTNQIRLLLEKKEDYYLNKIMSR